MRIFWFYFLFGLIALSLAYFLFLLQPISQSKLVENFLIEPGQGFQNIARLLIEENLIKSKLVFEIYGFLSGSASRLKPGNYELSGNLSTPEIIAILVAGPAVDVEVTIIEGDDLTKIEKKLADLGIIKRGELNKFSGELVGEFSFLKNAKSLEGFLFPDTYRFFLDSSAEEVIGKFLKNFQDKALPLLDQKSIRQLADKNQTLTDYQLLILASLIEKEVPFLEDRLLVSGILYKRLKIDMPLQVDAAPDTYKYYGLPSKPIANPGLDAIYAALHPKISDYLYYLSDPRTKKTIFSRTLEEHNENRFRYLKK